MLPTLEGAVRPDQRTPVTALSAQCSVTGWWLPTADPLPLHGTCRNWGEQISRELSGSVMSNSLRPHGL